MRWTILSTLLLCIQTMCGFSAAEGPRRLILDDFDGGEQNRWGGYRNTFEKAPSLADALRGPGARLGPLGNGLQLQATKGDGGYCGYWIHFFDFRLPNPKFIDASGFKFLSFWVRGLSGGERFMIKLADQRWVEKEDSVPIGSVTKFLPGGVTTRWQEVLVPLDGDHSLKMDRLGGMTIEFDAPGKTQIQIDMISLSTEPSRGAPVAQPVAPLPAAAVVKKRGKRAIWLWTTTDVIRDNTQTRRFITHCTAEGVEDVWAQLPYQIYRGRRGSAQSDTVCTINHEAALRQFLKQASDAGLRVHALDGMPEFACRQYHHISLALTDAVLRFNRQHEESFAGVHFDHEPHLLVGWHDPEARRGILYEMLTLYQQCAGRCTEASDPIEFGVDIPFWLQDPTEGSTDAVGKVSFMGQAKPASYHLIDLLPSVGIMNYRDTAQGADGMNVHGRDLLTYADGAGKAKLWMGVETYHADPQTYLFVVGHGRTEFLSRLRGEHSAWARRSRFEGRRLILVNDGDSIHIGAEMPSQMQDDQREAFAKSLLAIAEAFGFADDPDIAIQRQTQLGKTLVEQTQWSDLKRRSIKDPQSGRTYQLVQARRSMLDKVTFGDETIKRFDGQVGAAEEYFMRHSSYQGIAVHDYDAWVRLRRGEAVKLVKQP